MSFDRSTLLEQQVSVLQRDLDSLRKEFHEAMSQVAEAVTGITKVHRMFTAYVDENLVELREKSGLEVVRKDEGGKEL